MNGYAPIFIVGATLLAIERLRPGRELPRAPGWYARAALLNATAQGFLCWFVGTFVFYWWHRARHEVDLLWRILHQIHHSASRIETLTSFYKHPLEIALNSVLSSAIIFVLLGASVEAAGWYSVFAALGELALVQRFDARSNNFPSMHVSVAMLTALHLLPHLGATAFAFPVLIALSCLFTKQHYVIDLPAGALLGWSSFGAYRALF